MRVASAVMSTGCHSVVRMRAWGGMLSCCLTCSSELVPTKVRETKWRCGVSVGCDVTTMALVPGICSLSHISPVIRLYCLTLASVGDVYARLLLRHTVFTAMGATGWVSLA